MARHIVRIARETPVRAALTLSSSLLLGSLALAAPQKAGGTSTSGGVGSGGSRTVDTSPQNKLRFPYGVQTFETKENIKLGESVTRLPGWIVESNSGLLSAVVTNSGGPSQFGIDHGRWACVEDLGSVANDALVTPLIEAPAPWNYAWSFKLQLTNAPPSGNDAVFAVQHKVGSGFEDAWGFRLTDAGAVFFRETAFGASETAPLFDYTGATALGTWVDVRIEASLQHNVLRAFVNGAPVASLGLRPSATTNVEKLRFVLHAVGVGSGTTVFVDEVGVAFLSPTCKEDHLIDFTTEDDDTTLLVNGQDITTPPEFGEEMAIAGSGPNNGAAIFDSTIGGPNDPSQDTDLLVDQGNILILQTDAAANPPPVAGVYPRPNDDEDGGLITILFNRPSVPFTVDLIDIDAAANETVVVTLTDFSALTRTFTVPPDWTGNGGVGNLDLTTLAAQPGFNSSATAVEDLGFDPNAVVSMTFDLGGSGGIDNLHFEVPCVVLAFEVEDDGTPVFSGTPIADGQDLSTPPEFGVEVAISDAGPNAGAATFDSTPGGPNDPGPDNDLLVGLGNILILQNDLFATQTTAGFFDTPNDDTNGGSLFFDFPAGVNCCSMDLIDVDEEEAVGVTVTLLDTGGKTRVFTVPPAWTKDRLNDGNPAFQTLDLTTLAPQPGFAATATAVEDPGFDPDEVIKATVALGGAQAMDNFCFCP
jgi:hypothetical protein